MFNPPQQSPGTYHHHCLYFSVMANVPFIGIWAFLSLQFLLKLAKFQSIPRYFLMSSNYIFHLCSPANFVSEQQPPCVLVISMKQTTQLFQLYNIKIKGWYMFQTSAFTLGVKMTIQQCFQLLLGCGKAITNCFSLQMPSTSSDFDQT